MSESWPNVRLGEILIERQERPTEDDLFSGRFRVIEKISFNNGLITFRSDVATKTGMILARPGDLIVSGINAAKGSIATYGEENDEPIIATIHYGAYITNKDRVDVRFLWLMLRSVFFRELLLEYVPGGIKTELKAKRLLPIPVPLPPLSQQRQIVARIEELAAKITEARSLRQQAVEETEAFQHSRLTSILTELETSESTERDSLQAFAEVNPSRFGQVTLTPMDFVSFVPMKAVDGITGTIAWPEIKSFAEVSKGYKWFKNGDVIFARITPCMQNGKAALARKLINGVGFGSTEFHILRAGPKLLPEWLHVLVRHKIFRDDAAAHFKGTAGQQRVPERFLLEKRVLVPPLPEQRRIVAELDALQEKVDALKRLQAETAAELAALLPSVLDRAFKGEL